SERQRCARLRFIPTRVGRGGGRATVRCSFPVHPHSRGERRSGRSLSFAPLGSSPLAWGEEKGGEFAVGQRRFIPTRVGRGSPPTAGTSPQPVHPHSRGERIR